MAAPTSGIGIRRAWVHFHRPLCPRHWGHCTARMARLAAGSGSMSPPRVHYTLGLPGRLSHAGRGVRSMATYPDATEQADEIIEHADEHQHLVIDPFVLPENVALTDLLTQAGAVSTDIFTIEAVREDGLGEVHVGRRLRTDSEASRVGIQTVDGEDPRVDIEDIHRIIWHGPLDGPPSDREVVNCRYCGEAFVNTRGNSLKPGLCIGCRTR